MSVREEFFDSHGSRCAADLYLPDERIRPVPCVVLAHGGSGTKRLGLPAYAEKFAAGGIAALVFDYRGFGASEGQPRQVIDVAAQRADYLARTLQFTLAAIRDRRRARRGEPPLLVPVVAPPGQVAVFTEPDARRTFEALGGEATGWRNELAPRFFFALPRYEPGTAERLHMPLLVCLADHDLQASSAFAARIAATAACVDIRHYPLGHFDVYRNPAFEQISDLQLAFLRANLRSRAAVDSTGGALTAL
ncbi:alpha/beta hydrolase [Actinomycetospora chibensis]|uniref:Alpha/beta hydrolase n=1 Tax=Actinomycetospora chibensis TaxID=663606 RepID=A0ABV9RKY7_9PSEU|nr:hypothetical protein [Actinomycetospora chibensis]MDD7924628.1 hypothetical protein [Actinomycetospora chibensis]